MESFSDGCHGSLKIHRDVDLSAALLWPGRDVEFTVQGDRRAWMQVVRGFLNVNGRRLAAGDGLGVVAQDTLAISADTHCELLLFDLPA